MMKTKSVVRPREIQRMVLDLERLGLALAEWKLALFASRMVRRDEELRREVDSIMSPLPDG